MSNWPPDVVYRWKVLCLDGATGKVLWEQTAHGKRLDQFEVYVEADGSLWQGKPFTGPEQAF